MEVIVRNLVDPTTYRRLAYLLSALVLGPVWFAALITGWSVTVGLAVTPLVIPALIVVAFMTRGLAEVEVLVARALLDVDAHAPSAHPTRPGFWAWLRAQFSPSFWRAQAYLLIRWFAGFPVAIAVLVALSAAFGTLAWPAWVPFVHGGMNIGFWRPHTFLQSLAGVPIGLLLIPISLLITRPLASLFQTIATALLKPDPVPVTNASSDALLRREGPRRPPQYALEIHAAADSVLVFAAIAIWAVTSRGYFWPVWLVLPFAAALAIHAWIVVLAEQPSIVERFRGNRTLAVSTGVGAALAAYCTAIWAITSQGYFWPVWPILGIAIVLAAELMVALVVSPRRAALTERIETLETTRAGAVDAQESGATPDRTRPARRRSGAAGVARDEPRDGRAEAVAGPRASRRAAGRGARRGRARAARAARPRPRDPPPVLADRGLEAAVAVARQTSAAACRGVGGRRPAACAGGRERGLLRRRRGARQRRQARAGRSGWTSGSQRRRRPRARGARQRRAAVPTPTAPGCRACAAGSRRSTAPCR